MDATQLLIADHEQAEELFQRFEQAGERAHKTKQKLVDQMITELTVHAEVEEEMFYPAVKSQVKQARGEVLESVEEHHLVETLMQEIKDLRPEDEAFDAKVAVLIENMRHHRRQEEQELFPMVRAAIPEEELEDLGERLKQSKEQKLAEIG